MASTSPGSAQEGRHEVRDPHRSHGWSARRDAQAVGVRRRQGLRLVLGVRPLPGIAPTRWRHALLRGDRDPDRGRDGHAAHPAGQRRLLRRVPQSRAARQVAHHHRPPLEWPRRLRLGAAGTTSRRRPTASRFRPSAPARTCSRSTRRSCACSWIRSSGARPSRGSTSAWRTPRTIPSRCSPGSRSGSAGAARSVPSGRPQSTPTDGTGPTSARTSGSTRARSSTSGARRRGATRRRSCAP